MRLDSLQEIFKESAEGAEPHIILNTVKAILETASDVTSISDNEMSELFNSTYIHLIQNER